MTALTEICKSSVEPYLIPMLSDCLNIGSADKAPSVQQASQAAARGLINGICPYGARFLIPTIISVMNPQGRWQQKCAPFHSRASQWQLCAQDIPEHAPVCRLRVASV